MSILRIRRSQLISKHGVGSVFPGTDGISRLTAGLDKWFTHEYDENNKDIYKADFKIKEWRLEQRLGVSHFRAPPDYRKFEYFLLCIYAIYSLSRLLKYMILAVET